MSTPNDSGSSLDLRWVFADGLAHVLADNITDAAAFVALCGLAGPVYRVALAALSEACLVAASVARHLGHAELAVATARRGVEAAWRLGDSTRAGR
ncbi:MAG: hypothetical protein LC799_17155 [Actinobacteria bacterium]|nr:hypothetical protein [Actinomycetota bacterium]